MGDLASLTAHHQTDHGRTLSTAAAYAANPADVILVNQASEPPGP